MFTKQRSTPWNNGDKVQVVFPGNGMLTNCEVIAVITPKKGEPLYDIEVPFQHHDFDGEPGEGAPMKSGKFRLHKVRQWFLSYTQDDWDKMRQEEGESTTVESLLPALGEIMKPS